MRWRYGYVANASLAITTYVFTVKIALVTTVLTVYQGATTLPNHRVEANEATVGRELTPKERA